MASQKMVAAVVAHLLPFFMGGAGICFLLLASLQDDEALRRLGLLLVILTGPISVAVSLAIVGG